MRIVQCTRSVTGHQSGDSSRQIATICHRLSVGDISAIECHSPHLYECLWRNYCRTRNIVIHHLFICIVCGLSRPITNHTPFGNPLRIGYVGHVWFKWVPANLTLGGNPASHPEGSRNTSSHFMYINSKVGHLNTISGQKDEN